MPKEEWPYELPEGWEWVRLEGVADIINGDRGKNYPSKKDYQSSGIPFINAGAIQENKLCVDEFNYISELKYNSLRSGKVAKGDILYCLRGSLGKVAIVDIDCPGAISSSLCILRTNEYILEKYFYYLLRSYVIERQQMSVENGSAQPNLSAASVKAYALPLPPQETQQRIVNRIEGLFAKLDQAKEKAQHALATSETRKAAILHQAFTGQLTKKWREENGVTMESWEYLKIGEFAKVKGGKRLPKGHCLTTEKTAHPYLRIADFGENTIDCSDLQYIDDETFAEISKYTISANDVYLSIVGSIGKAGTIPMELDGANLTENAAKISTNRTLPKFLALFLSSSQAQEDIQRRIRSATLGKLSLLNIKDMQVSLPSLSEQQEIVHILDALMANERRIQQAVETILQQIDDTKKSILAKAFRGEWQ